MLPGLEIPEAAALRQSQASGDTSRSRVCCGPLRRAGPGHGRRRCGGDRFRARRVRSALSSSIGRLDEDNPFARSQREQCERNLAAEAYHARRALLPGPRRDLVDGHPTMTRTTSRQGDRAGGGGDRRCPESVSAAPGKEHNILPCSSLRTSLGVARQRRIWRSGVGFGRRRLEAGAGGC